MSEFYKHLAPTEQALQFDKWDFPLRNLCDLCGSAVNRLQSY